ncbi:MAG: DMT family transporter [Chloroflexi bacterium]|nr:DMT family transporter [Chloroflexota bacterium]
MGEISALGSAFLWAANGALLRSQAGRIPALALNAIQYLCASAVLLVFLLPLGYVGQALHLGGGLLLYLAGSALVGMAGGDTLYIHSLRLIGIARAFPLSNSLYVLFTFAVAATFLREPVGWAEAAGGALVVAGMSCLALAQGGVEQTMPSGRTGPLQGLLASAGAAACWTISIFLLKVLLVEVDILTANALRLPLVALTLLTVAWLGGAGPRRKDFNGYSLALVGAAGVLGITLGSLAFLFAVQVAGAAKTAVLASSSPLFAVLLSLVFYRREVTRSVVLGTALCVAGIALIA